MDIKNRVYEDTYKPNNRLVNNFCSYITDIRNGYFTGIPITYESKNLEYLNALRDVFDRNNESDKTNELDKIVNIKGHGYEIVYINDDGDIKFNYVEPNEIVFVYASDLDEKPLMALRYYDDVSINDESIINRNIFIYTNTDIYQYRSVITISDRLNNNITNITNNNYTSNLQFVDIYPHGFSQIPIIEYVNNRERLGSFEGIISLNDAYNTVQSDTVNDIEYFSDAYLKITNMSATEEADLVDMKQNRIILVDGDGDAEWLVKNVNDAYNENLKDRIARDIHKFSKTPNLVSEEFVSNLSGVAIRYKVWGLEQDTSSKERKWLASIYKRIELITEILNIKLSKQYNYKDIKITFNRNLPINITEIGQFVSQLRGTVSLETLLSQLPFVNNIDEEIKRLDNENSNNPYNTVLSEITNNNNNGDIESNVMEQSDENIN